MHSNGEYSRYDHLSYNSSKVKVGQYIKVGEEIANVGMTGYTYLPHLHFQVFIVTGINVWTMIQNNPLPNLGSPKNHSPQTYLHQHQYL
jgi:murein DD-endopeptidase MepM/ murein hydrolase activator NlpD